MEFKVFFLNRVSGKFDLPGILSAVFGVDGNKFVLRNRTLAHRTCLGATRLLEPLVNARPAIKMSAKSDNRLSHNIETNIAFK